MAMADRRPWTVGADASRRRCGHTHRHGRWGVLLVERRLGLSEEQESSHVEPA